MPERAICVDETIHAGLQCCFAGFSLPGSFRGSIALRQISQLKPLKERRPSRIDGLWIFLPAPVILFNQVQIRASIN